MDTRELRNAYGTFITGVTVVTAVSADGVPVGFTANSYTSVSLDPPLVLVCPARSLASFDIFNSCEHFAVNILAETQADIANVFSTVTTDRFAGVDWEPDDRGCPKLHGSASVFCCTAQQRITAGDHLVLIGQIRHFETSGEAGLGYSNGGYFSLGLERRAAELPRPARAVSVGVIIEHDSHVLLERTPSGLCPPQVQATRRTGSLGAIRKHLRAAGMTLEFGPVYSIFENRVTGEYSTFYRAHADDGETRGLGEYVHVDDLESASFASDALSDMMRRYVLERKNGIFRLYVGDEIDGDVHLFGEESAS